MADLEFETGLDRMFAQSPTFADAPLFALKVENRLERGWTFRQALIVGLGLIGGLFGVMQVVSSGLLGRAEVFSAQSSKLLSNDLHRFMPLSLSFLDLPFGRQILWMSAILAVVALVLAVMRVIEEI
jgi:amino acid transporter